MKGVLFQFWMDLRCTRPNVIRRVTAARLFRWHFHLMDNSLPGAMLMVISRSGMCKLAQSEPSPPRLNLINRLRVYGSVPMVVSWLLGRVAHTPLKSGM